MKSRLGAWQRVRLTMTRRTAAHASLAAAGTGVAGLRDKRGAQLRAGVEPPSLPPQPLAIEEVGAGQLDAHTSPPESPDRLLIEALGPVAVAQEGARTRLHPERPVAVARVRGQREQVKRPFRGGTLSGASSRLHELGDRPLGAQFRIRCDFDGLAY